MSDQMSGWMDDARDPSVEDAPTQILPSLVAPAVFLDPAAPRDGDAPPAQPAAASGVVASMSAATPAAQTSETPVELRDEPLGDLWAEPLPDEDVRTLRTLLLGGEPHGHEERLAAIEQRLEGLASSQVLGQAPAEDGARLAAIERRLDALARQLDDAHGAARAGDVTLQSLAELQRQIQDLRLDHAHATVDLVAQIRQADDRCRLRQRRARASVRLELLQLRRRVYARPQGQGQTYRASTRTVGAAQSAAAAAQPGREMDAQTAWRAVRSHSAALAHALFALIVVLAHLAAEDLRAAGEQLVGLFRRH